MAKALIPVVCSMVFPDTVAAAPEEPLPYFFMKPQELDGQLHQLLETEMDDEFIAFCQDIALRHPVALDLKTKAVQWKECLEKAMITFSGYKSETWREYAEKAKLIVRQEMLTGRWNDIPSDEEKVGKLVAYFSYLDIATTDEDPEDTTIIYKFIGAETYAAVALNDCFDGHSFRRIFVTAWFTYFLEQLTLPLTETPSGRQCAS